MNERALVTLRGLEGCTVVIRIPAKYWRMRDTGFVDLDRDALRADGYDRSVDFPGCRNLFIDLRPWPNNRVVVTTWKDAAPPAIRTQTLRERARTFLDRLRDNFPGGNSFHQLN